MSSSETGSDDSAKNSTPDKQPIGDAGIMRLFEAIIDDACSLPEVEIVRSLENCGIDYAKLSAKFDRMLKSAKENAGLNRGENCLPKSQIRP